MYISILIDKSIKRELREWCCACIDRENSRYIS